MFSIAALDVVWANIILQILQISIGRVEIHVVQNLLMDDILVEHLFINSLPLEHTSSQKITFH